MTKRPNRMRLCSTPAAGRTLKVFRNGCFCSLHSGSGSVWAACPLSPSVWPHLWLGWGPRGTEPGWERALGRGWRFALHRWLPLFLSFLWTGNFLVFPFFSFSIVWTWSGSCTASQTELFSLIQVLLELLQHSSPPLCTLKAGGNAPETTFLFLFCLSCLPSDIWSCPCCCFGFF